MKQIRLLRLIVAGVAIMLAGPLHAGPILLGAFSGGESIETFTNLTAPAPGAFTLGNNTFSENSTGSGGPGWRVIFASDVLTDNAGITDITIDLATAFSRVGMDVWIGPATYTVSFYDTALSLLGTVSGTDLGTQDSFFAGWEHAGGISRINILETSGENGLVGGLDNLRWENVTVPEPTILALLGLGLAVIGFGRRKQQSA
ncbi:PEP-CTERM sorting domain-containing protein [Aliiglaciecola litoralis]|uniref:Ice-binding protein C-terminal domain-containing protein n=1 Tax=Aliiglaciecola litoralis TaxID=582857 RepID=A0ABP3WRJ1_9ALTE